ncbi:MAG: DNA repair protein RecO C-terminal domain-containing protein, partial [Alphaproteobacteria bacterium]|nr:DNA repair protein RecO C-terminal domain-containing protein [Alphaproteobacteria bacterium]
AFVRWELGVLSELGFGLDLSQCAATGSNDGLVWVSPKSGRAVSAAAGADYADRLLRLPPFLVGGGAAMAADIADGLRLTGHFLTRHGLHRDDAALPAARDRLSEFFR